MTHERNENTSTHLDDVVNDSLEGRFGNLGEREVTERGKAETGKEEGGREDADGYI